ncbi:hypothetical protein B0H17DRAFT_1066526, partial [Mycena rosella]
PTQLISLSYTPEREFEFTDSALHYLVQPPRNAQLAHAYDRCPERRSRIDGLSYCTSHTPGGANVPQNPGDPPAGDTRMVIGGEVDCAGKKYTGATDTFAELKTPLVIRGPTTKKLLKFYIQSFLLGVPEILVGFRTPAGQVSTTNAFLGFLQDVWRLRFYAGMGVELRLLDAAEVDDLVAEEERMGFLPRVYWDEVAG